MNTAATLEEQQEALEKIAHKGLQGSGKASEIAAGLNGVPVPQGGEQHSWC